MKRTNGSLMKFNKHSVFSKLLRISIISFGILSSQAAIQLGDVIKVDFGAKSPAASNNYNVLNSGALKVLDLIRSSDGSGTGVGLTVTATKPFDNVNNAASTSKLEELNYTDVTVYGDGLLSVDGNNGAGNDIITITFNGLDDSLSYDLVGGLSRSSGSNNFESTWAVDGAKSQVPDGTTNGGHVSFKQLNASSGSLTITITDNKRQSGVAQLTLTAVQQTEAPKAIKTGSPSILAIERESSGDVILTLDREAENIVVEQSEDLIRFFTIESKVEAANDKQLRISAANLHSKNKVEKECFRISRKPNFIIIFTDDQGYQDLGVQGSPTVVTPRIDKMAAEGIRFTDFYAQAVCGPSRDALLTGCYPLRTASHPDIIGGKHDRVSPHPRLELSEITVAEILKTQGYATEAYGKWDLEGRFKFKAPATHGPTGQGFDAYYKTKAGVDDTTQADTKHVLSFIDKNKTKPFFAYVAYNMPHVELALTPAFDGITKNGKYADVMAEIDASVGAIIDKLIAEDLDEHTYVLFMSDNGPWYLGNSKSHIKKYGSPAKAEAQGGSALPLRGDKTTSWEGGFRVPSIIWAPGRIPAGQVSSEIASTLDVMPTIVKLAGSSVPKDRVIDGHDISPIIHGHPGAKSPTDAFFFYVRETLHAVRAGKWKMHVPHASDTFWERFYRTGDYFPVTSNLLYDLDKDIGETTDVSGANADVVRDLMNHIKWARKDIGDGAQIGINAR